MVGSGPADLGSNPRETIQLWKLYEVDSLSGTVVRIHNVAFKLQGPRETIHFTIQE